MKRSRRLNVTLDPQRARKLARLAERARTSESLARTLLSAALDEAEADPRDVVALLERIPGSLDRAYKGLRQARSRQTIDLSDL